MNKKIFSILTFAIAIGLLIPNTVYFNIYETEKNIKYNLHDNEMIKPCALAPKEQRLKSIQQNPFITDYFAPYFFSKLYDNFGYNSKGTCSYVAADMLLSFYDTFWSDDFLPEKYDSDIVTVDTSILFSNSSPGSKWEEDIGVDYSHISDEQYYTMVQKNSKKRSI